METLLKSIAVIGAVGASILVYDLIKSKKKKIEEKELEKNKKKNTKNKKDENIKPKKNTKEKATEEERNYSLINFINGGWINNFSISEKYIFTIFDDKTVRALRVSDISNSPTFDLLFLIEMCIFYLNLNFIFF